MGLSRAEKNTDLYGAYILEVENKFFVEFVQEYQFTSKRLFAFDYALPCCKLGLEIEGGVWSKKGHTSGKVFIRDMDKFNLAQMLGWRVLRIASHKINKLNDLMGDWFYYHPCNHEDNSVLTW